MSGRRPVKKGSFGGHFDELVKHFPHEDRGSSAKAPHHEMPEAQQEKLSIHARLFERAWRLERED